LARETACRFGWEINGTTPIEDVDMRALYPTNVVPYVAAPHVLGVRHPRVDISW
jgi:hypothetical protein